MKTIIFQVKALTLAACLLYAQKFGPNKDIAGPEWDALYYWGKLFPKDAKRIADECYPIS